MSSESPTGEVPGASVAEGEPPAEANAVAPAQLSERNGFWSEFQRHPVYRVGALYAVVAWAVAQASDMVLEAFEAPHWVIKCVLIATVAGFPIALLLARMFHPHADAARDVSAQRIWLLKGLGVALLAASLTATGFIARRVLSAPAASLGAGASGVKILSLAVLPLAQLAPSDDSSFADGMYEDLITRLAAIRDLHVLSREVMLPFRDSKKDGSDIGRELGANYVLSGSVRRAGNELRINARLVETEKGGNVWAKTYDRQLTDVFRLQAELSTDIAQSLTPVLTPSERKQLEQPVSANVEAYDLYVKATSNSDWRAAEKDLERAVELDPNFARAWSELGWLRGGAYLWNAIHTPEQLQKAKSAIDRAFSLAPQDPQVRMRVANFFGQAYRDWERVYRELELVADQQPNSAILASKLAHAARRRGDIAAAIAQVERGRRLEPLWPGLSEQLGGLYLGMRRYSEANMLYLQMSKTKQLTFEAALYWQLAAFQANHATSSFERWLATMPQQMKSVPSQTRRLRDLSWELGLLPSYLELAHSVEPGPPDDSDLQQIYLGLALLEQGDAAGKQTIEHVRDSLQQRVREQPENATLWSLLGMSLAMTGATPSDALAAGRRAVRLLPREIDAIDGPRNRSAYACTLTWSGDLAGAVAELEQLLSNYYDQAPGFYLPLEVDALRRCLVWKPLRGFPAFEAMLANPKFSAPL